jgi:uncharacterized protein (DUF1501 family)
MNRRKFIKNSIPLTAAPLVLDKIPLSPFVTKNMLENFSCDTSDRALIVIFMMGGNDGFNTLVPLDQYTKYRNYRPTIYIPETGANKYIDLDTTVDANQSLGLNPIMSQFKSLYDNGNAHIVQAVGYPNANKSHFKSTDLWLTGGDGMGNNASLDSGHFGRFLDNQYPNLVGNPSTNDPDPLGIQLGNSTISLGYLTQQNLNASANLTDQDPSGFFSVVQDIGTSPHNSTPNNEYGIELDYIMDVEKNTSIYAQRISSVFQGGSNSAVTYPDHYLAYQLKTVARLIAGGSKTKVFLLHTYGFDTHDDQITTPGNPSIGRHAEILSQVFDSIKAFQDDITNLGIQDRIITTTMSEFGRKVIENGALGTDHGTLAPIFLFGDPVAGGITGTNIDLDNQDNQGAPNNNQLQYDYRQIFASLYQDWLGASDTILDTSLNGMYQKISLVDTPFIVDPSCYGSVVPVELFSFKAQKVAESVAEIRWVTLSEAEHDHYVIERSSDGVNYELLKRVKSTGSPTEKAEYEIYDTEPIIGINYYRLKSIDLDGSHFYSQIESVTFKRKLVKSINTYPNPASVEALVSINAQQSFTANLKIFDIQGHQLMNSSIQVEKGFQKFPLNVADLSSGIYLISLVDRQGELANSKLIISN